MDETVDSMLRMLDAIKEHFSDQPSSALKRLVEEEALGFYFLPLDELKQTDELYIKMNSRGRQLTPFENFKAQFLSDIGEAHGAEKRKRDCRVARKKGMR